MVNFKDISNNYMNYIDLLLIGDESLKMIKKYIDKSTVYGLFDNDLKSIIVIENIDKGYEIKNFATYPKYQKQGYGTKLLNYIIERYKTEDNNIFLGTGENPKTLNFYKSFGFEFSHIIKGFFTDNYENIIVEENIMLKDMIYLKL